MGSLDIVVPIYNEADGLAAFHATLEAVVRSLVIDIRFIYVNDGSTDKTAAILRDMARQDPRVVPLELSRNFGHQAALTAGLEYADADMVVMMDGDGQHPASLIPEMVRLHEAGYDIVQTQRMDTRETARLKAWMARGFYALLNRIGELKVAPGTADFRLISRDVLYAVRQVHEYHRFLRGIISWVGFRSILLPYRPSPRQAGLPKYTLRKMLRLAGDGLFSFSLLPLRLGILLGVLFLALAVGELSYIATLWLSGRYAQLVPGWSSIIVLITVAGGVTMILLGFIGVYVGMIFQEVKRRPVYVLRASPSKQMALGAAREVGDTTLI